MGQTVSEQIIVDGMTGTPVFVSTEENHRLRGVKGRRIAMQNLLPEPVKLRIHALWDRATELGALHVDDALEMVLSELSELLDAQYTWWMGALRLTDICGRDPLSGWRPRAIYNLNPSSERDYVKKEHCRRIENGNIDQSVVENMRSVGQFRINIMHEMMPETWFTSDYYETLYKPFGMRDAIYVVTPIGESVESWMAFERNGPDKPHYGEYERQLLGYAMRPMKWFHHQLVLRHGVQLAGNPLTLSEQKVLAGLLTDKTEQEIAAKLSLSRTTVHTYCTRIYRKFGVRGRAGLTALWLGKALEA